MYICMIPSQLGVRISATQNSQQKPQPSLSDFQLLTLNSSTRLRPPEVQLHESKYNLLTFFVSLSTFNSPASAGNTASRGILSQTAPRCDSRPASLPLHRRERPPANPPRPVETKRAPSSPAAGENDREPLRFAGLPQASW